MLNRLFIQLLEHECMMCHKHLKYLESLLLCSDLLVHFRFLTVHCLFTFGFTSVDVASLSLLLQCLDYYAFDSFPKTCTEHITFSFFLPPPELCYLILRTLIYIVKSTSIEKVLNCIVIYSFREILCGSIHHTTTKNTLSVWDFLGFFLRSSLIYLQSDDKENAL